MSKNYQTKIDAAVTAAGGRAGQVTIAMAELAGEVREGLLALAVGDRVAGDGTRSWTGRDRGVRAARAATTRSGRRCATAARPGR